MKLHHIGFVVNSIDKFEKNLLFESKIYEVEDPVQHSKLSLYKNYSSSYIELIEPLNEDAFTFNFLKKNGEGWHHLCYEADSIEEMDVLVNKMNFIKVLGPVPALLFNNRNVYFYYTRNKSIVEFLL